MLQIVLKLSHHQAEMRLTHSRKGQGSKQAWAQVTCVLTKSCLSSMDTLPTATPMHSTFFSWNLTDDLISLTCKAPRPHHQISSSPVKAAATHATMADSYLSM